MGVGDSAVWVWLSRVRVEGIPVRLTVTFTPPGPKPLPPKGLQYLVLLSHAHSRECSLVPGLRGPGDQDGGLVWECSAGHTFSWGPSSGPTPPEEAKLIPIPSTAQRRRSWCSQARVGQDPTGKLGKGELWRKAGKGFHLWSSEPYSLKICLSLWKILCLQGNISSNMFLGIKSKIQNRFTVCYHWWESKGRKSV